MLILTESQTDVKGSTEGCGLHHSDRLKEAYKNKRKSCYFDYEERLLCILKNIVAETDRKIENAQLRLRKPHPEQDAMKLVYFLLIL